MRVLGRRWPRGLPGRLLGRRRGISGLITAAILALLVAWERGRLGGPASTNPAPVGEPAQWERDGAGLRVARVDDGDTIALEDGRQVRYLGIDSPEKGEPFCEEAAAANRRLVAEARIRLVPGPEGQDRYGRILACVFADGGGGLGPNGAGPGASVNAALVRAGLASVYVTGPGAVPVGILDALIAAQNQAISEKRGFWPQRLSRAAARSASFVATRFRIHRPDCEEVRARRLEPAASVEEELRKGKSPCRICKPLP